MEARLQRRIQRYGWDRAARDYEAYWGRQVAPAQEKLLEMAALGSGELVADVACGTGLVTLAAARAVGPRGAVLGTDISEAMVEAARVKAAEMGAENVRFERADAESHDLPEGSFDAVLCSLGLMYVPDPVAALRAMRRLLKPGGRAVQAVWGERGRCGWAGIFAVVDARVETEVCPLFFQLGTGDALEAAMREAGFRDVRVERVRSRLFYMNAEEALGAAFVGGPVAMAYSRFEEAVRESAHAEYLESIEGFRVGAGYEIPGEFAVGYGVN